ncbi:MAG TPA: hypothetical protein VGN63_22475 [Flavisolibacter sp.]|nr:hypothetical protein [Flavisolibacter sp.]
MILLAGDKKIVIEPQRGSLSSFIIFHRVAPGAIHMEALRAWVREESSSH